MNNRKNETRDVVVRKLEEVTYGHRQEERIGPKALAADMVEKRRVAVKTQDCCLTRAAVGG